MAIQRRSEDGITAKALQRRKEVTALRVQGISIRGIAAELGVNRGTVENDLRWIHSHWGELPGNTKEAIRGELVDGLRHVMGVMIGDIAKQTVTGQRIVATDGNGTEVGAQAKQWVNPQSVAEVGRTAERISKIAGVADSGIDANTQQAAVVVNLPAPGLGPEFTGGCPVTETAPSLEASQATIDSKASAE
jgi:hypothetical protein